MHHEENLGGCHAFQPSLRDRNGYIEDLWWSERGLRIEVQGLIVLIGSMRFYVDYMSKYRDGSGRFYSCVGPPRHAVS